MAHDVFISYSKFDKPTADAVCAILEAAHIRCWIAPRDILPSADWGESIIDGIVGSKAMVLVFSSKANESPQVKREVERAIHRGIPIIPFRIEDVEPVKSLEYFLSMPHWLDAFTAPLERHLTYLVDVMRRLLNMPPEVPKAPAIVEPPPSPPAPPMPSNRDEPSNDRGVLNQPSPAPDQVTKPRRRNQWFLVALFNVGAAVALALTLLPKNPSTAPATAAPPETAAAPAPTPQQSPPPAPQAPKLAEIRFGIDPTYPPFESLSAGGDYIGFDVDLGRAICARLQARCVFVNHPFDGLIPALQAGDFDAILSSMSVTPARAQQIDFSAQMFDEPTVLITRRGAGLAPSAPSLAGKTVGVESGTIQESYAKTYWQPNGVNIVSYPGQDQLYQDLLAGKLDASLQDSVEADYGFLRTPAGANFMMAGNVTDDPQGALGSYVAIGIRKNETALKTAINSAIAAILRDGTYQSIEARYFRYNVYDASANGPSLMSP